MGALRGVPAEEVAEAGSSTAGCRQGGNLPLPLFRKRHPRRMLPVFTDIGLADGVGQKVFQNVIKTLKSHFYQPELLNESWRKSVEEYRPVIENASTRGDFEAAITALLATLGTSHLGFFHSSGKRASSRAALSASYLAEITELGSRWVFQDVHNGGAAATSGIEPGNILLQVNGKEIVPPVHPLFPMGEPSKLTIVGNDGLTKAVNVEVARPKSKERRKLQYIEPTLVESRQICEGVGYLKVAAFPGIIGVDVANAMSKAIDDLGAVDKLIVDLRGNAGGGAGALRLMSLLTPDRLRVGFSPGKRWIKRDLTIEKESFPRLSRIPASKRLLWLLNLKFLVPLMTKSPIVLETEGLGPRRYHGRIILLVDRQTTSAAEMVAIFAKEEGLATIVGEPTGGRLLSMNSLKVGHGFRLAIPIGGYCTWRGTVLEGFPIQPDVLVPFDWRSRRSGIDQQLEKACSMMQA